MKSLSFSDKCDFFLKMSLVGFVVGLVVLFGFHTITGYVLVGITALVPSLLCYKQLTEKKTDDNKRLFFIYLMETFFVIAVVFALTLVGVNKYVVLWCEAVFLGLILYFNFVTNTKNQLPIYIVAPLLYVFVIVGTFLIW